GGRTVRSAWGGFGAPGGGSSVLTPGGVPARSGVGVEIPPPPAGRRVRADRRDALPHLARRAGHWGDDGPGAPPPRDRGSGGGEALPWRNLNAFPSDVLPARAIFALAMERQHGVEHEALARQPVRRRRAPARRRSRASSSRGILSCPPARSLRLSRGHTGTSDQSGRAGWRPRPAKGT